MQTSKYIDIEKHKQVYNCGYLNRRLAKPRLKYLNRLTVHWQLQIEVKQDKQRDDKPNVKNRFRRLVQELQLIILFGVNPFQGECWLDYWISEFIEDHSLLYPYSYSKVSSIQTRYFKRSKLLITPFSHTTTIHCPVLCSPRHNKTLKAR